MIITLCGSNRFEEHFKFYNKLFTLAGHCVFSISAYPSDENKGKDWYTEDDKIILDQVHKDKIALSNAVVILNVFGYVGDSTMTEIEWARRHRHISLYALESWGKGLGIGSMHYDWIQAKCKKLVPEYKGSPIDSTLKNGFHNIYSGNDLFWKAGERRSRLVHLIDEFENKWRETK